VVDRALSLVAPLLPAAPSVDFGGELLPEAPAEELAARLGNELAPVLVQPGAGWGSKRWPPERWGEVAAELGAVTGSPVGVLAAPGEEPLAAAVVAAGRGRARALPALGLLELVAVLRRAALVLGGDTGPVHLAHALGTPVLMLMGPTDPERHGPWGAPRAALAHRMPCGFCYKRFAETKACLLQILPHHVAATARSLLSSAR
jgi:heptosyltransferase I